MRKQAPDHGPGSPLSVTRWRTEDASRSVPLFQCLASRLKVSPEEASDLIDFGSVQVNGHRERKPARILEGGEEIAVYWPWTGVRRHYEIDPRRIVFQDSCLLAYDKEAGIPSQQTPSDAYNNVFAAAYRYREKLGGKDPYVALHHRLDRETSGILLLALDREVNRHLGNAFRDRRVVKDYAAWVSGTPARDSWVSREPIGRKGGRYRTVPPGEGKPAETLFWVLSRRENGSLVRARPVTGRTHQIRLHLEAAGHPILGDRLYGGPPEKRLFLHAWCLQLRHPVSGSPLVLPAAVPPDWPEPRPDIPPD